MSDKKMIMVVDDDGQTVYLLTKLLTAEGFNVTSVNSGKECLECIENVKPDLVILDMMMTEMTGIDVAYAIKKKPEAEHTKILFLTSLTKEESDSLISDKFKTLSMKMQALDYIKKPFKNEDFVKRVKDALSK